MRISVLTEDKYLKRKIELELGDRAQLVSSENADATVTEIVDANGAVSGIRVHTAGGTFTLPVPFAVGALKAVFDEAGGSTARLGIDKARKCALLDGRAIPLTTHEYALFILLYESAGSYVTREKIMSTVWEGGNDRLVNLYIHYLREKLECGQERIIISSRGEGYRINKAYLGGEG
jgi:DNA-binding response OmpR family regulator